MLDIHFMKTIVLFLVSVIPVTLRAQTFVATFNLCQIQVANLGTNNKGKITTTKGDGFLVACDSKNKTCIVGRKNEETTSDDFEKVNFMGVGNLNVFQGDGGLKIVFDTKMKIGLMTVNIQGTDLIGNYACRGELVRTE